MATTRRVIVILLGLVLDSCAASATDKPAGLVVHEAPRPLPGISFSDETGGPLTLASLRGKVVVLNVWATWCFPCREEMPTLDRLQAQFDPRDVAVIALSIDQKGLNPVRKFFNEIGVKHLSPYHDASARALRQLGLIGLPGTLVIDRAGREIGRVLGGAEWDSRDIVAFLKAQVQQAPHGDAPKQAEAQ
ncbi:TlpA disulfide reductase family protein [Microvirga aerilata]|uniref:TlpA family protein disulfide reductase n=1 Tax=Microvirga aerilata TaxID=670292 RepID=UPI0028B00FA5|nr:TlpA disulfide reductase family protein [Microvirga aerilata]